MVELLREEVIEMVKNKFTGELFGLFNNLTMSFETSPRLFLQLKNGEAILIIEL